MKKLVLLLVCLCSGCAGYRTRVTLTSVNGKPAVSFEVEEARISRSGTK